MSEPVPVLTLDYAKPARVARPAYLRVLEFATLILCAVGWVLLAAVEVETVLFTGPILSTAGAVLVVGGALKRDRQSVIVGVAHISICLLLTVAVRVNSWSPGEAETPFTVVGGVYTLAFLGLYVGLRARQRHRAASMS